MMYTHETPYMYAYGYATTSSSSSSTQIMSMSHQVAAAAAEGEGDHHIHTHGDSNHLHDEQLEWMSHSCSSPSSSSYGSPTFPITRSLSTHSLLSNNNNNNALLLRPYPHLSPFISSTTTAVAAATPNDYLDLMIMDTTSVRRVLSTGDLHRMKKGWEYGGGPGRSRRTESEVSSESNAIIQGMNRASPYSPQEKKQRIERYRSKRNHRNFTKKIKYACRKTLADSRPRIRGRFARNDEIGKNSQLLQWNQIEEEEDDDDDDDDVDDNWINYLDSVSPNMFT